MGNSTDKVMDSCDKCAAAIKTEFGCTYLDVALEAVELLERKRRDYGPYNLKRFGEKGIVIRLGDKFDRLVNLVVVGKEPANEAVEDTWMDVIGYGILGLLEHRDNSKSIVG